MVAIFPDCTEVVSVISLIGGKAENLSMNKGIDMLFQKKQQLEIKMFDLVRHNPKLKIYVLVLSEVFHSNVEILQT